MAKIDKRIVRRMLNTAKQMRIKADNDELENDPEGGTSYDYFDGKVQALSEILLIAK